LGRTWDRSRCSPGQDQPGRSTDRARTALCIATARGTIEEWIVGLNARRFERRFVIHDDLHEGRLRFQPSKLGVGRSIPLMG
jgi:hypothetical protein